MMWDFDAPKTSGRNSRRVCSERVLNIVFDLGGVVVSWEPDAIIAEVFADPAVRTIVRAQVVGHADWVALDRGTLAPRDAVRRAAKRTGLPEAELAEFLRHVPAALVPNPGMVELLYRLKARGHDLFCLSNMHVASIEYLEAAHAFWEVFAGVVISCRLKLCKPEPAIYAHLLQTYRLDASRTVFIDDVDVNVAAAATFGIHAIKFETLLKCERDLRALGCI
jgi:putative hydrolase of the HAD superfamily